MALAEQSSKAFDSLDVLGALWRYRWAVVLPTLMASTVGFIFYAMLPETYRSTTRLMVESDRPPILNQSTGQVVGAVPDIEVLEKELYSDVLGKMAFSDTNMQPFQELHENDLDEFISDAHDQLQLEPEVTDLKTAASLVTLLHFDSKDREHCVAAVRAYSKALQDYYNQKHRSSRGELIRYIDVAMKQLNPKITELERRYGEFRIDAPLQWDSEGNAINPHREQQHYLMNHKNVLLERLNAKETVLASLQELSSQTKDPRVVLTVISQVLGVRMLSPTGVEDQRIAMAEDPMLIDVEVDKKLLPLMIERNKNAREFGPNHPSVKYLDSEIATMKAELSRLIRVESTRRAALRKESAEDQIDPLDTARQTIEALILQAEVEVKIAQQDVADVEEQIATEKKSSVKLAKFEQDNEQMNRELEHYRGLMSELKEQMARASLTEEDSVTRIRELTKPSPAYIVSPTIPKTVGVGTFLGLLLGSMLALLLEKNANTFRDHEEIATMLGVPVLTHIPFFRTRQRKGKKGASPYSELNSDLVVVHQPGSVASEAMRSFRTAVFFDSASSKEGRVIQITSPLPGDGKSTIACNLACSIAQSGKRVLAIDCDLRRPQLTDNFQAADKLGLTNVLNGECDPTEAAHQTPLPKLHIMPCGPIPSNPAEALSLPVMNELLDMLREHYDYIILDTPPLLVVTDPSITASMADAVVLTLRIRRKSKPNAKESVNILSAVGANVLGVVINNSDESSISDGYKGYGYYRGGKYASRYYSRGNGPVENGRTSVEVSGGPKLRRISSQSKGKAKVIQPMATANSKGSNPEPKSNGSNDISV